jgi:transcriptional regulator with XRE-family HTH domain
MQLVSIDPDVAKAQAQWNRLMNNQRAAWLRAAMKAKAISQADLGELLGMTPQAISQWSTADATIDWRSRMAVLVALELPQLWEPREPLPPAQPNKKRVRAK